MYTLILHFRGAPARGYTVPDVDTASRLMRQHIETYNYGASDMGKTNGQLFAADGLRIGTVHYNGRVELHALEPIEPPRFRKPETGL